MDKLFKLKKSSKTIGGFDLNDEDLYSFLKKNSVNDFPHFVHIKKLWNVTEVPPYVDPNTGETLQEGVEKQPVIEVLQGFIRDDKYIVQSNNTYTKKTFHEATLAYGRYLEKLIDDDYFKDDSLVDKPQYYRNERTPMIDTNVGVMMQQMIDNLGSQQAILPALQAQQYTEPPQPAPKPAFVPKKNGMFGILRKRENPIE